RQARYSPTISDGEGTPGGRGHRGGRPSCRPAHGRESRRDDDWFKPPCLRPIKPRKNFFARSLRRYKPAQRCAGVERTPSKRTTIGPIGFIFLPPRSAGTCAAILPYLSNLGLELVEEIIRCPGDNPVTNQEHRCALQIELLGEFLGLIERFLDVGVLRVLLQLIDV